MGAVGQKLIKLYLKKSLGGQSAALFGVACLFRTTPCPQPALLADVWELTHLPYKPIHLTFRVQGVLSRH
jgi:hypothetical protein